MAAPYTAINREQSKELAKKLLDYFAKAKPFGEYEIVDAQGNKLLKRYPNQIPTFNKFARMQGITRMTLYKWAHKTKKDSSKLMFPELAEAYEVCKDYKHDILLDGALCGVYNSDITKLELKNYHNYKDRLEQDIKQDIKINEFSEWIKTLE